MDNICEFMSLRHKEDLDNGMLNLKPAAGRRDNNREYKSRDAHNNGVHYRGSDRKPYQLSTTYRHSDDRNYLLARKAHRENDGRHRDYPSNHCEEDHK